MKTFLVQIKYQEIQLWSFQIKMAYLYIYDRKFMVFKKNRK